MGDQSRGEVEAIKAGHTLQPVSIGEGACVRVVVAKYIDVIRKGGSEEEGCGGVCIGGGGGAIPSVQARGGGEIEVPN
jgi:hypothetical protein